RSIGIKNTEGEPAISLGQIRIPLNWNIIDSQNVEFSIAQENSLAAGEWTVTIPSGFFEGINHNGTAISNTSDIVFPYIIKTPATFSWSIDPADGAETEFLRNIIIHFTGDNLRRVAVDTSAGTPVMTGRSSSLSYTLTGKGTSYCAILSVTDVASVPEDTYDIVIPAGYIVTTDSDQLRAAVPEIRSTITVKNSSVDDYTDGILFLNEGWYGNDTGSLNFYSNACDWTYNAFLCNNPDHRLGTTSQYGQCFGNRIYLVSKQSGTESGITGGQFTALDAATLGFIGQIDRVPDQKAQPRAFCAWDEHKGYLSTDRQIYVVDLDKPEILSVVPGTDQQTSSDSYGEMLRFADRVFAIRQSTGVDVIDPATENVVTIPAELAEAFAVTADGSLYVATRNESNEFIRISPTAPYQLQMIDIENDKSKIANIWSTWRKAPIAAGTTGNVVYYVTQAEAEANPAGARHIARYDFDTETFTPDFITLPGVAQGYDADWMLYGEGISVNPANGKILLSAVESGYGVHYSHNRVFMADPHTGEILADETLEPKDGYWFPAMTLYPDFSAPSIDIAMIDLPYGPAEFTLSLSEATVLRSGNIHLVNYQAYGTGCEVDKCDQAGVFTVRVPDSQAYELRLCAEYQGKKTEVTVKQSAASGIAAVESDIRYAEVYDISGIVVLRDASEAEIRRLAPGIYIAGGRKFMVRH
ncbi:MAG: DUF5074 domain-containing protein, partial [Muribaculaceae bacterium]|nr:DUF5074 domain-containing protein [Muribaculaceae bacterium]